MRNIKNHIVITNFTAKLRFSSVAINGTRRKSVICVVISVKCVLAVSTLLDVSDTFLLEKTSYRLGTLEQADGLSLPSSMQDAEYLAVAEDGAAA